MPRRPYKADIILSDKKFKYGFEPTRDELDNFLDKHLDTIIKGMTNSDAYKVRITTNIEGIICDVKITKDTFNELYYYLVGL